MWTYATQPAILYSGVDGSVSNEYLDERGGRRLFSKRVILCFQISYQSAHLLFEQLDRTKGLGTCEGDRLFR